MSFFQHSVSGLIPALFPRLGNEPSHNQWVRLWLLPLLAIITIALGHSHNTDWFLMANHLGQQLPTHFWPYFTVLGDTMVCFALLTPFVLKNPRGAAGVTLALLIGTVLVHPLKWLAGAPRPLGVLDPSLFQVIGPALKNNAFPSGHTATAFALAAVMMGYNLRFSLSLVLTVLACMVGFSRMAVGVHWPMDVLTGMTMGWISGFIGLNLASRLNEKWVNGIYIFTVGVLLISDVLLIVKHNSGYETARLLEQAIGVVMLGAGLYRIRPRPSITS